MLHALLFSLKSPQNSITKKKFSTFGPLQGTKQIPLRHEGIMNWSSWDKRITSKAMYWFKPLLASLHQKLYNSI